MTTQIIVNAYCPKDKEIKVEIAGDNPREFTLQDCETKDDLFIYNNQEILVKEVLKKE